jgi:hypothetical protein
MRPHHFLLILVCIATNLLVFESALSLSRIKPKYDVLADTVLTLPWGGSS